MNKVALFWRTKHDANYGLRKEGWKETEHKYSSVPSTMLCSNYKGGFFCYILNFLLFL